MKIALWQTTPRHTITEALEALKIQPHKRRKTGAELLATPEMFIGGYNIGEAQVRRHAMQSDSVISKLHGITITYKPAVIVGMANNFDQSPTNSCIAINAAGKILGKYDKNASLWRCGLSTIYCRHAIVQGCHAERLAYRFGDLLRC